MYVETCFPTEDLVEMGNVVLLCVQPNSKFTKAFNIILRLPVFCRPRH
jgi:hypothetical protein